MIPPTAKATLLLGALLLTVSVDATRLSNKPKQAVQRHLEGHEAPRIDYVGNNGSPSDVFPLAVCQGDCDNDDECAGDLICFERDDDEQVPGCETPDGKAIGSDFCVEPGAEPLVTEPPVISISIEGNNGNGPFPLGLCEGDCDDDDECEGDLVCFKRDGTESVPGCTDSDKYDGNDFCVNPDGSSTPDVTDAPAIDIEDIPDITDTDLNGTDISDAPNQVISICDDEECTEPLQQCQGDCDNDDDCEGDLICWQRDDDEDPVPGCVGAELFGSTDFCTVDPDAPEEEEDLVPIGSYDDLAWSDLPDEVREAAETLGYDEDSWDNGLGVEADELSWEELTPEQQDAAMVFGYTQEAWDNPATMEPTSEGTFTESNATIVDLAVATEDLSTLVDLVVLADLAETLAGEGPFTVFAPTNAAFAELDPELVTALTDDPSGALTNVLLYHVVSGTVLSTDLEDGAMVATVAGPSVLVSLTDDGAMINDANVVAADIIASNGVVHVIDKVLIPPVDEPTEEGPDMDAPATDSPVTEVPGTDAPSTDAPGTESPATGTPSTGAPEMDMDMDMGEDMDGDMDTDTDMDMDMDDPAADETQAPEETEEELVAIGTYDDLAWSELPDDVQAAAGALGYDEDSWDNGGDVESEDKSWDELTPEEQEAAMVFGYNQELWDGSRRRGRRNLRRAHQQQQRMWAS